MWHIYYVDPVTIKSVTCHNFSGSYEFRRLVEMPYYYERLSCSTRERLIKEKREYLLYKAAEAMGKLYAIKPFAKVLLKEFNEYSCLPEKIREIITKAKAKEIIEKGQGEKYLLNKLKNRKVLAEILAHVQVKIRVLSDIVATRCSYLSEGRYGYTTITLPDDILKLVDKK